MHPTIQAYFNAFDAADVDGMLNCLDDAVTHHVNEGQVRIGKDAFRSFLPTYERMLP
jgi:ketosteroid isomerase-like protein